MAQIASLTTLEDLDTYIASTPDSDTSYVYPSMQTPEAKPTKRVGSKHRIELGYLTKNNIGTLRKLNYVLFPVRYSDKWYKDVLREDFEDFCRLVYFNDVPVGAIAARLEAYSSPAATDFSDSESIEDVKLYIMTLGVLAPYRRKGLGKMMLDHIVDEAEKTWHTPPSSDKSKPAPKPKTRRRVKLLYVHVQVSNTESKEFWEKMGFVVKGEVKDYYKMIEPRDALILEREISVLSESQE
ncbi:acyl-CoA N-acyltransferase [Atractiella rhizophila]|nr:acyl-CoA N-acyltransferase [Atractiella rhizophila]